MIATLYVTHVYNQAVGVQSALIEVRSSKAPEKFAKLYDLVRSKETGMVSIIKSGNGGVMMDAFYKLFFELRTAEEMLSAYDTLLDEVTVETEEIANTITSAIPFLSKFTSSRKSCVQVAKDLLIGKAVSNSYGPLNPDKPLDPAVQAAITKDSLLSEGNLFDDLDKYSAERQRFSRSMGWTRITPYADQCLAERLFRLQTLLNLFGTWLLPGLFGMLGAFVYYMRRYLNPGVPNPNPVRIVYRVALGAFGGILIVGLFYPYTQKSADGGFATYSAFAVAFLVGYSLDIFFAVVDAAGAGIARITAKQ